MVRLQVRGFTELGVVREFPNGNTTVLKLDDTTVGYGVYQPGFRWSTDLAPLAGTPTCQLDHVGYAMSGVLHVVTDDGRESDVRAHSLFEIPPGHDAWVVGDEPVVLIDWASARAWRPIGDSDDPGVVVTLLLTDIVDSTATIRSVGDQAWRESLASHHGRMRELLNVHQGREIKTTGDGLVAAFARPVRAVRCAEAMVAASQAMGLPIRIGIHTGEVEFIGNDAQGLAMHTVARLMPLGDANDVVMSSTTRDLLEGSGYRLTDAGEHDLKGLPGMRRVFRLGT